jgi:hypothetical protein
MSDKIISNANIKAFIEYAEDITAKAMYALAGRCGHPETDAEIAIHLAYIDGMKYACSLPLAQIERKGTELGISVCQQLVAKKWFGTVTDLSAHEFIEQCSQDERKLPEIWQQQDDPLIAEAVAFWQGINDVYEFAVCFATHAVYSDDYRHIRPAVEQSLARNGLLRAWNEQVDDILYAEFTPPRSCQAFRTAGVFNQKSGL